MKIQTTRFGKIEIDENEIITMPDGPLGYPDCTQWIFIDEERAAPFRMFQSLDNETLAFIMVDPLFARPDYSFRVTKEDIKLLSNEKYLQTSTKNLHLYCIVTMKRNVSEVTVNLQGPFVINPLTKLAHQFVITDGSYTTREKLLQDQK